MTSYTSWSDRNAHAAADRAVRLMGDGATPQQAIEEAARSYSADARDVSAWVSRIALGEKYINEPL